MRVTWLSVLPLLLTACAPQERGGARRTMPHEIEIQVRHPGVASGEPQTYTVRQIFDEQGFPFEYVMTVDSVICPDGVCLVSSVKMVWDALGQYRRYELPAGAFLEKGVAARAGLAAAEPVAEWAGTPFTEADYKKLDEILKDRGSLLGEKKLAETFQLHKTAKVDGVTGATPASIRNAVVEGASLTCYNLWHWANGDMVGTIKELTCRQCSEPMLLHFLHAEEPSYVLFALEQLKRRACFGRDVVEAVCAVMQGDDRDRLEGGLAYLQAAQPEPEVFYGTVANLVNGITSEGRQYVLGKLASGPSLPSAFFEKLAAGLPDWNGYYEIHLFLRLAEKQGYTSPPLNRQVSRLLACPDFFIARRAYWFLSKQREVGPETQGALQAFQKKAEQEGRIL